MLKRLLKGNTGFAKFYSTTWQTFIALKNVKKYFREAPKVVKVMRINIQYEINIKLK